jgi:hypothetical protein
MFQEVGEGRRESTKALKIQKCVIQIIKMKNK